MMIPCIDCGQPAKRTRCPQCERSRYYQTPQWRRLRKTIAGQPCAICNSTRRVAAHHARPRRDGGPDTPANLIPLCQTCHSQYEGDKRAQRTTQLTSTVEALQSD